MRSAQRDSHCFTGSFARRSRHQVAQTEQGEHDAYQSQDHLHGQSISMRRTQAGPPLRVGRRWSVLRLAGVWRYVNLPAAHGAGVAAGEGR